MSEIQKIHSDGQIVGARLLRTITTLASSGKDHHRLKQHMKARVAPYMGSLVCRTRFMEELPSVGHSPWGKMSIKDKS